MHATPRLVAAAVVAGSWTCGVSACADIWGFQDGVRDSTDGGQLAAEAGWPSDGRSDVYVWPPEASEDSATDVAVATACPLACIAAPPPGWSGPYELSEAVGGAPAPCSDSAYPVDVYGGVASPTAPAASCECTCGAVTGSRCKPPTITLFRGGMCSPASQCATVAMPLGACVDFELGCDGTHMQVTAPVPLPGTCAASAATRIPDAGWAASARLCGVREPSSRACAAGEVCAPPASLPFASCIARAEIAPCPSGPYTSRRVYYGTATDTRGCSECSCGAPSMDCTGGTVATFGGMGCLTPPLVTWSAPQSCAELRGDQSAVYEGDAVPNAGPCKPVGGVPSGQLTPASPTTICCTR